MSIPIRIIQPHDCYYPCGVAFPYLWHEIVLLTFVLFWFQQIGVWYWGRSSGFSEWWCTSIAVSYYHLLSSLCAMFCCIAPPRMSAQAVTPTSRKRRRVVERISFMVRWLWGRVKKLNSSPMHAIFSGKYCSGQKQMKDQACSVILVSCYHMDAKPGRYEYDDPISLCHSQIHHFQCLSQCQRHKVTKNKETDERSRSQWTWWKYFMEV